MPMYQCYAPAGTLGDADRATLASSITDIHCSLTTAPPTFVHVVYHEYQPSWAPGPFALHGGIRAGRPASVTNELVAQMTSAMASVIGVDRSEITMQTAETPASWIMEGGAVLPEPGEESDWLVAHR